MSRSSAPPLRLGLKTDRILPALGVAGLLLLAAGVLAYAFRYSNLPVALGLGALAAVAGAWTRVQRAPHWDWLGCDAQGQWWLATRAGLRHEERVPIRVCSGSRVFFWLVVLVYRPAGGGGTQALWLPWWRLAPDDFRRLRVRLRWGLVLEEKPRALNRLRAGASRAVAILGANTRFGEPRMNAPREMPAVEHLLSDDPAHVYSEDELDAIEAIDAELALRLDRAQTFARHQATEVPVDDPIDEAAVRQAVEEARRILMQDGGDIEYIGLEGRTVQVRLKGACVGCPRSALDLRNVVERLVRSRAPGVERVANTF
ncbi:nitrogen-fixing NifU domain protein [Thioalkalivibrio nitratireducens DSM 14787]|uniref:Nitrogen-fixing NifU domain protein n=1 Tax=Thioalkalivibrio nitratireducens (strain DSM 14787 / UNIQEM 213 / ALEN2) TaxID=1255043 RepID=L0DVS3_THIND|nr:NifU family protein [Thioalkalivibrio nitratireducens]AGA33117.1 nitrogen-fixing NifU domain protein [Thioalkalivibrio nitratireducens DSM 14787]